MLRLWQRLMDWMCGKIGLCIRFDGDLMAPSGDEAWWSDGAEVER